MNELDQLITRLRDLHDGERAFFEVIQTGPAAIPALEAVVREEPQSVFAHRCLAADALAAIGGPDAWSALLRALEDLSARHVPASLAIAEDAVVDRIAVHLGASGDPRVPEALLAALAARPRGEVARALGRLHEERAIPMLIACLDDDLAREGAMEALRSFGDAAGEALARKLVPGDAASTYEAPHLTAGRVAAAELLGDIPSPAAAQALSRALDDPSPQVRRASALAFATSKMPAPDAAIPVLIEALDHPDWLTAKPVIDALVLLGHPAVTPLLNLLDEPVRDASGERRRQRALEALSQLAPEEAVPAISRLAAASTAPRTGLAAVAALAAIPGTPATTALGAFLDHPAASVRERAVRALAARGTGGTNAMARALADPDRRVRHAVWECAHTLDPPARDAFIDAVCDHGSVLQRILLRLHLHSGSKSHR